MFSYIILGSSFMGSEFAEEIQAGRSNDSPDHLQWRWRSKPEDTPEIHKSGIPSCVFESGAVAF